MAPNQLKNILSREEVKQIKEQNYIWNEVEEVQNVSWSVKEMKDRTKKYI